MCSQNSLVSVIIPVYRVEKYLDRCIESIVNQTHRNLEIILIDDGSPDRCPEICDRWARQDERVIVIHQKNLGVSAARNAGIAVARGSYIVFVDSDDFVRRDFCETLYTLMVSNHAEMGVCSHAIVDEEGYVIPKYLFKHSHRPGVYSGRELLRRGFISAIGGVMLTADFCRKESFPEERSVGEDFYYLCHLTVDCNVIAITNKKLYMYTQRSESTMGGLRQCANEERISAQVTLLLDLYQMFKSRGLPSAAFRTLHSAYYCVTDPIRYGYYFKNHNYRIINRQMRLLIAKTIQLEKAGSFKFFLRIIKFFLRHGVYPAMKNWLAWRWRTVKRRLSI